MMLLSSCIHAIPVDHQVGSSKQTKGVPSQGGNGAPKSNPQKPVPAQQKVQPQTQQSITRPNLALTGQQQQINTPQSVNFLQDFHRLTGQPVQAQRIDIPSQSTNSQPNNKPPHQQQNQSPLQQQQQQLNKKPSSNQLQGDNKPPPQQSPDSPKNEQGKNPPPKTDSNKSKLQQAFEPIKNKPEAATKLLTTAGEAGVSVGLGATGNVPGTIGTAALAVGHASEAATKYNEGKDAQKEQEAKAKQEKEKNEGQGKDGKSSGSPKSPEQGTSKT